MEDKKSKTLLLNTLLLIFCVGIIAAFCFGPSNKVNILKEYNIVFDSDGGSAIAALKIGEGNLLDQPPAPTREGYIFAGWMLGDDMFDFSTAITGDITLKAKWEEMKPDATYYKVSFLTDGGNELAPITVEEGATGMPPIPPVKEGFRFVEWQLDGVTYDFTLPIMSDLTLTAIWEAEVVEPEEPGVTKFRVTFNVNGGTRVNAQSIEEGKTATKPRDPSRAGFTFNGWYLNNQPYDFSTPVTKAITLVAQWTEIPKMIYTVNVYTDSGSSLCSTFSVTEGNGANIPGNCVAKAKDGYKFVGWNTRADQSSGNFNSGGAVNSNLNLYPAYARKNFAVSCTKSGNTGSPTCLLNASIDGVPYTGSVKLTWGGISQSFNSGTIIPLGTYPDNVVAEFNDGSYVATVTFKVS